MKRIRARYRHAGPLVLVLASMAGLCLPLHAQAPLPVSRRYCGQTPPALIPAVFAPGLVSTQGVHEFGITFSPDGKEVYFGRRRGPSWDSMTIMTSRFVDGAWTEAVEAPFAKGFRPMEPHITADGNTLYFSSKVRPPEGGGGESNLWAVDRQGSGWSKPRFVCAGMFTSSSRDGSLYLTLYPDFLLARATLEGGRIRDTRVLEGGMTEVRDRFGQVAHPCISPDGDWLLFDVDGSHLFASFRQPDGSWGGAIDLSARGLPADAGLASISQDGAFIFFFHDGDIWWVGSALVTGLKNAK